MVIQEVTEYMLDWDYEENVKSGLFPDMVTVQSRKRVYWRCHVCRGQWNTQAKERRGCPYCNNFKALPGYNDFATTHPEISKQWDYEKNGELLPENFTYGSQKKVFWKCINGHSWDAQINSRAAGQGCPYCNNRRVLVGYNDLATVNPDLAQEWDYEKNDIAPENVCIGSEKKIWWVCHVCGFEWKASVNNRYRGSGCPECGKLERKKNVAKTYVSRSGSLAEKQPDLIREWDFEKNTDFLPEEVTCGSTKKVWWICGNCGNNWRASIGSRMRKKGGGCPKCGNIEREKKRRQKRIDEKGSITITHPSLIEEWNIEKNKGLSPDAVTAGSGRKVWWHCPKCGCEWQAVIYDRCRNRTKCPSCRK
jgi:hypothetical protein